MANTLTSTLNWSLPYIEYSPMNAGTNNEPAVSICSMIRNSMLFLPPIGWAFNRVEDSTKSTQVNVQDYTYTNTDFGFLEKASLIDSNNQVIEIKDVYNTAALSLGGDQQQPHAIAVILNNPGTGFKIRFMGIPDQVYTIVLTYQKLAVQFGSFPITSVMNASGGTTEYIGTFDPLSFLVGQSASISGLKTVPNNGAFTIVSVNATTLIVNNPNGQAETDPGLVVNQSWAPIPDSYSDIYNNLFLGESLAVVDDTRSQIYRQRGVAAFLAKAEGLSDTQKNIFAQQWLAQGREQNSVTLKLQQGVQGRGI
jgi:hypothetical protein